MVSRAGAIVFMLGNKEEDGRCVQASGVLEEFRLGEARGCLPIPIGATGHAALAIWEEVRSKLPEIFGDKAKAVTQPFDKLNDAASTDDEITCAVIEILTAIVPR